MGVLQRAVAAAACAGHAYWLWRAYQQQVVRGEQAPPPLGFALGASLAYVVGVLALPRLMRAAKLTFDVTDAMSAYNAYMTALSAMMLLVLGAQGDWTRPFSMPVDHSRAGNLLRWALWVNYNSKFVEYLDSVWMIARGKYEQLSLLHTSHHTVMGPVMWLIVAHAPGGTSFFGPWMNSTVHTFMYFYYFMTGVGVRLPGWMKRAMTTGQMIQFGVAMAHALFQLYHWNKYWPAHVAGVEAALMVQMFVLFGDFYVRSYMTKRPSGAPRDKKAA